MPEYILNGEPIEVAPEHVEIFMAQNPEAKLEEEQLLWGPVWTMVLWSYRR